MKEHARWRDPEGEADWDANHASQVEAADAAISAWTAAARSRALDQKLSEDDEKLHGGLLRAAKERELAPWERFKVVQDSQGRYPA